MFCFVWQIVQNPKILSLQSEHQGNQKIFIFEKQEPLIIFLADD